MATFLHRQIAKERGLFGLNKNNKVMNRRKIIGIIFIVAALLKLADMWGILHLNWDHSWSEYFGPVLLLYVGIELLIYSFRHNPSQWLKRPLPQGEDGKRICCSVSFGADEYIYHGEIFHGARLDALCGGLRLDLRQASISEDEEIDIHTFLGGVELLVPAHVNVIVKSHNFLGGVSDETAKCTDEHTHTIHITASNFLGGLSVKNQ